MLTLSSQELPFRGRVLGVNETGGVDLNLVHIYAISTNSHEHLLAVTGGVLSISSGKIVDIGAMLLEERIVGKVGSIATSGKDNWTFRSVFLSIEFVDNTNCLVAFLVDLGDTGLLDQLAAFRLRFCQLFISFHKGISDSHAGEFGIVTTVSTGLRLTTSGQLAATSKKRYCATYPNREMRVRSRLNSSINHSTAAADL